MVRRWFASVGAPARLDSVGWGVVERSIEDLLALLDLWDSHWLVMEIDSSMLRGGGKWPTQRHWVVVDPETRPLILPGSGGGSMTPGKFAAQHRAKPFGGASMPREAYGAAAAAAVQNRQYETAQTTMRVVSWAEEHVPVSGATLSNVASRFYGGYAFLRFNR